MIRAVALGLLCLVSAARAHPVAASIGEAHWRPARRVLEIAIRLPTHDVQATLKTADVDADALKAWTLARFAVNGAAPHWVGAEVKPDATWVYLEASMKPGTIVRIRHGLLFDISPMQVNTLNVTIGVEKVTLGFTRAEAEQTIVVPGG